MPWLSLNGLLFELSRNETIVGSGPQATWRIQAVDLRPRHFVVEVHGDRVTVRPCGTHDVVALNGKQVASEAVPLTDGDMIAAGSGVFAYSTDYPEPRDDFAPLLPPVAYLIEDAARRAFPLEHASTGIGRDPSNAIVVTDGEASRFHAEVRREAGGFALHGTGSAGTRVNGHFVNGACLLEDGDEISVASHTFRFTNGPLPSELSTTLEMVAVNPLLARHPTGAFPTAMRQQMAAPSRDTRLRTVFGVVALLVLLAVALAFLTR
jgi:predicted component of type VI protein secretion system